MKGNSMKITISGDLGSGKSTIGKALAQAWNYNFYSTGDIFRKLSSERGLDILQANKQSEEDRSLDDAVDDLSKKLERMRIILFSILVLLGILYLIVFLSIFIAILILQQEEYFVPTEGMNRQIH